MGTIKRLRKVSFSDGVFQFFNYGLIALFSFVCLFPFLNSVANAFSSNHAIQTGAVTIFPVDWQWDAMKTVSGDSKILRSLLVTVYLTAFGTLLNMIATIITAYPLSRRDLKGRSIFLNFMIFTMLFSGGMIPTFLLVKSLGLLDSLWALIIPVLLNPFYVIIMKTFFQNIPEELREAATVDGCGNIRYLLRIVIPLSGASIATISLFYAVWHWNSFFNAVLYINSPELYPLQVKLRNILLLAQMDTSLETLQQNDLKLMEESLKAATVVFATFPILVVYPFLQKYFVKGALLGSVKG